MRIDMIIPILRRVRLIPALLVLLLGVRVATAAAVECQHELNASARSAAEAQAELRLEAVRLGGELCLVVDKTTAEDVHDGPHLSTPCPFFKSPVTLTGIVDEAPPRPVIFVQLAHLDADFRASLPVIATAYSARAPPVAGLG